MHSYRKPKLPIDMEYALSSTGNGDGLAIMNKVVMFTPVMVVVLTMMNQMVMFTLVMVMVLTMMNQMVMLAPEMMMVLAMMNQMMMLKLVMVTAMMIKMVMFTLVMVMVLHHHQGEHHHLIHNCDGAHNDESDGDVHTGDGNYEIHKSKNTSKEGPSSTYECNPDELVYHATKMLQIKKTMTETMMSNIEKAQQKDKFYYDQKHSRVISV